MNKKIIIKIFLISLLLTLAFCTKAYCAVDPSTTRIKIDNSDPWVNINISDSYTECEALNSTSSTLGTAALKAHLTTDYDWNAMAIFSVSQYGAATNNGPSTTTGNKSGVYDVSSKTQTTTLLNTSTSTSTAYLSGLYDESGNIKKYVNKINPTTGEDQNGRTAIAYVTDGGTYSWLGSWIYRGTQTGYPVGIKQGLFGVNIGYGSGYGGVSTSGGPFSDLTFRPVIWN